jgi:hypothetical protein
MALVRAANLTAKFLLELAAIAALAYWGTTVGGGAVPVVAAVLAPAVAVVVWGTFAAPRAARRLATPARVPLELAVFGIAVAALATAGSPLAAAVLAGAVLVNAALLTALRQWDG